MQDIRIAQLQAYLLNECAGNKSELSRLTRKSQSYISDLLRGKKSFGEKAARGMEQSLKLTPGYFDQVQSAKAKGIRVTSSPYADIAPDDYPALLANRVRDWDEGEQLALLNFIEAINAAARERRVSARKRPVPHRQK